MNIFSVFSNNNFFKEIHANIYWTIDVNNKGEINSTLNNWINFFYYCSNFSPNFIVFSCNSSTNQNYLMNLNTILIDKLQSKRELIKNKKKIIVCMLINDNYL